jgi:hypothetical protein
MYPEPSVSFGERIETRAKALGIQDQVASLSSMRAVKLIQKTEGSVPCYAWKQPLQPGGHGYDPLSRSGGHGARCGVSDCLWRAECDSARASQGSNAMHFILESRLRDFIEERVYWAGHLEAITDLTDSNAIRLIQECEGYSPCYGRPEPLQAEPEDPKTCTVYDCYWRTPCNNHRSSTAVLLETVLDGENRKRIEALTQLLRDPQPAQAMLDQQHGVGLQMRTFRNLDSATKKMLVATPQTVVGERSDDLENMQAYVLDYEIGMDQAASTYSSPAMRYTYEVAFSNDLPHLRNWFFEAEPFIKTGQLAYYPLLTRVSNTIGIGRGNAVAGRPSPVFVGSLQDVHIDNFEAPHLGLPDGDIMLTDPDFAPIINLDLPVLTGVDYKTLFTVMNDHPDEMQSFRDFLHGQVEELRGTAVTSADFGSDLRRIERDVRDRVRKLDSDFKQAKLKATFSVVGCVVATWTLALYCMVKGSPDTLSLIGPGGIVYVATDAYADYWTKKLAMKTEPAYFLWVLGKSRRRS